MVGSRLGYAKVSGAPALVTSGPAALFGIVGVTSVASCIVYDSIAASGNILWSGALTLGQVVHFGGQGIAVGNGLYVSVGGAETVNILFA